jgi:predicted nucleotidyltransferase
MNPLNTPKPKDRETILRRLGHEVTSLRRRFGVKDIAVFGSLARDELNEGSDLDFLVTFEGKPDFDRFMDLTLYLEDIFARPIDLVTKNALRPELRPGIEREAIHVP